MKIRTDQLLAGRPLRVVATILAIALIAIPISGGVAGKQGGASYAPTQGEWLWLVLNTERALFTAEQEPGNVAVRYLYDRSKPNTIQIELLFLPDVSSEAIRSAAALAEGRTMQIAKLNGWDQWLKTEWKETKLTGPPPMETLIR